MTPRRIQLVLSLFLMLAVPACSRAYPTEAPTLTPIQPAAFLPAATETAVPTLRPTLTAAPVHSPTPRITPTLSSREVDFENVQLILPANLARAVISRAKPEFDRLGELYPAYTEFTLIGYGSKNTTFQPQVQIYPVQGLGSGATATVQELKELLTSRPASILRGAGIPILPTIPAGQLLDVQIQYLSFANGSGIRVLTQFAQDAGPIHNEGLVYIFQGLTDDQAHYISAFLPVSAAYLPDHVLDPSDIPPIDGVPYPQLSAQNFEADYSFYQNAASRKLNQTPAEEFTPSLDLLDDLIESIQIESVTAAQPGPTAPCVNAPPTRLSVNAFAYVNPDPPLPNNLRAEPGTAHELIGAVQPGQAVEIVEGPQCADAWVWWKVRTLTGGLVGWTPEGDQQSYWLVPCTSQSECGP